MKTKLRLLLQPVLLLLLAACAMGEEDWQQAVTGTYAASYEQFYSTGQDTLIIERKKQSPNYRVTKHTAYRRKGNDSTISIIHKSESYTATAEADRQTLYLFPSGRRFWYDRETETIHTGEFIYKKIQ